MSWMGEGEAELGVSMKRGGMQKERVKREGLTGGRIAQSGCPECREIGF